MRAPRAHARGAASRWKRSALEERDVDGLRALVARLGVIRDLRALGEGAEAVRVDAGVVDEEVLAPVVRRDEAEALLVAEPLDGSGCHVSVSSTGYVCCDRGGADEATCGRCALLVVESPLPRPVHRTLYLESATE